MTTYLQTNTLIARAKNTIKGFYGFDSFSGSGDVTNDYTGAPNSLPELEEYTLHKGGAVTDHTSSPIIGNKSLEYQNTDTDRASPDSTVHRIDNAAVDPSLQYLYFSAWVRLVSSKDNMGILGIEANSSDVLLLQTINGTELSLSGWGTTSGTGITLGTGSNAFIEVYTNLANSFATVRVNDNSVAQNTVDNNASDFGQFTARIIGNLGEFVIDNAIFEIGNFGSALEDDSTWQYNSGNGRTFSEYQSRYNL